MKRFKAFIIILIAVGTMLGLLYLISIAKEMEKYALSPSGGGSTFILVSVADESFKSISETQSLADYTSSLFKGAGYGCSCVDIRGMDHKSAQKTIRSAVKGAGSHMLVDIRPTKLVVSEKSVILRVSSLDEDKYGENLELAKEVKNKIKGKGLSIHIVIDDKQEYNQYQGEKCLRVELWDGVSEEGAKELISTILSAVIQ